MAFGRSKAAQPDAPEPPRRRSLVASAIRANFDDLSWNMTKWRDEAWQRELWRYYDILPEFGFAARWVGQCCSRVRIYVAKVDDLGRVQGETKNAKINALADSLLGGPAAKAEALRAMGINLTVAGECYVVGRPGEKIGSHRDEWFVLSPTEMRQVQGSDGIWYWAWDRPNGEPYRLDLDRNVITRVWTPHPQRVWCADSPSRSCQMVLRELEQLTKYIFSQIDSRLINAGVLIIPNNLDLPAEENTTNSSESLMYRFATAAAASLRGEGTALGVLPHIIESDNPEGFKFLTFESELSKQAMELRQEAVGRLGVGMDMPPEVLTGLSAGNHWCLSVDTSIYTRDRGWVNHDRLSVGDQVLTLNHETGASEWQPALAVNVFDVVDEPVLEMNSASHSSLSTINHRWPYIKTGKKVAGNPRRWTTSGEGFSWSDRVPVAAPCSTLPTEAKYSDDFVRLVAAYTSDGCILNHPDQRPTIRIAKFDDYEIAEVRRVLASVYGPGVAREYRHPTSTRDGLAFVLMTDQAEALFAVTGEHKAVNAEFINELTLAQLELFLSSLIDIGDGNIKGNSRLFFQVEPTRLAAIERVAILAGYAVRHGVRAKNTGFSKRPLYWISVSKSRTSFQPMDEKFQYSTFTGKVWCPTTANGTWLAKRNDKIFFTGNSGFLIDGYGIKIHIEPIMGRVCDALTKAYLYPALELMGEDPSKFTYAFDTAPLQLRPQRLQDALNLYEKGELTGDALRDAGYFKESEGPDDKERARRLLIEILLRDPQLLQNQAVREGAGIPESVVPQSAMIAPTAQSMVPGGSGGSGPPPPMPPPTGIGNSLPPPIPDTLGEVGAPPPGAPGVTSVASSPPTGITAAASRKALEEMGLVVLAEATVHRALELAGKKLLDRHNRNRWPDVPAHELHTRIKVQDQAHANRLLTNAWEQLDGLIKTAAPHFDRTESLQTSLSRYCSILLLSGTAHAPDNLFATLRSDGVINGQP